MRCFKVFRWEGGGGGEIGRGMHIYIMALSRDLKSLVEQVPFKDCFISLSFFYYYFLYSDDGDAHLSHQT